MSSGRRGFAMLTVLWAMVVVGTLTLSAALSGREAFDTGRNRVSATRAFWFANDCAERARAAIDSALSRADLMPGVTWRHLDAVVARDSLAHDIACAIAMEANGTRLDVNDASRDELERCFVAIGRADAPALADALIDWRDVDDDPLVDGAESAWYRARRRPVPRNGPIADFAELARIRGFEDGTAQRWLSVEEGPVSIPNADRPVLAAMPGFVDETLDAVLAARANGQEIDDLMAFASTLSSPARDSLVAHYQEISRRTTLDPAGWIVTATEHAGHPAVTAAVELRLVRTNRRASVVRRRVRA